MSYNLALVGVGVHENLGAGEVTRDRIGEALR